MYLIQKAKLSDLNCKLLDTTLDHVYLKSTRHTSHML